MEKEISNGSMLGIVLLTFCVILGLFFGILCIAKGTAEGSIDAANVSYCLALLSFSVSFIGLGIWLKYKNTKHNIWDNIGNEHKNILSDCDKDKYNAITTISIPKSVSLFTAIRCRLSKIREIESVDFERYIVRDIVGTVKIDGSFYIIGDKKLSRGLVLLNEGEIVNFRIKTFLNLETALGIYRIYDIL